MVEAMLVTRISSFLTFGDAVVGPTAGEMGHSNSSSDAHALPQE